MKKYVLTCLFLLIIFNCFCQSFQWAKRAGLWAFDLGYGIATDKAGNVYIAGKYEMNKASFGTTTVTCAGNHDMYVAKYSPSGEFYWVRTAGGISGDYAWAIASDSAGNVYVTGEIEGTANFGSGISLTSNGDNDVFLAKYNTNGTLQWAKKVGGGSKSDKALGISLFGDNIYLTGKYEGVATFSGTTLISAGEREIFIIKYKTSGTFQWAKSAGGTGNDEGYAICNDPAGNIYVTGYFSGVANFSGQLVTGNGGTDIFVARYNSAGSIAWVKKIGGTANDYGMSIKADNSYRLFLTGGFRLKTSFGTTTLTASGGDADIFVSRFDAGGNVIWAKKAGGAVNDYGRALALDASSNIFITGNYGLAATFGTTSISGADSAEIYFASYDKAGNFRWVLNVGGETDKSDPGRFIEMGLSIATDVSGNILASGAYRSLSTFGSTSLKPWDHTEIFLTKISPNTGAKMAHTIPKITPPDSASFCFGGYVLLQTAGDSSSTCIWRKNGIIIPGATNPSYRADTPGSYDAGFANGNDTIVTQPTIVTLNKQLNPLIKSSMPVFCRDSSAQLMANEGDGYLYQWKRNGRYIKGATSSTYRPSKNGNYQVKIIQGSCIGWSAPQKVELKYCGVNDTVQEKNSSPLLELAGDTTLMLKVFPNPNSGFFTIDINMAGLPQNSMGVQIEVFNAMGQILYLNKISYEQGNISHHIELDHSVAPGIYFLRVTAGDSTEQEKIMLVK